MKLEFLVLGVVGKLVIYTIHLFKGFKNNIKMIFLLKGCSNNARAVFGLKEFRG
jgi:hypothetical protein